jgi:hypothetical protein
MGLKAALSFVFGDDPSEFLENQRGGKRKNLHGL